MEAKDAGAVVNKGNAYPHVFVFEFRTATTPCASASMSLRGLARLARATLPVGFRPTVRSFSTETSSEMWNSHCRPLTVPAIAEMLDSDERIVSLFDTGSDSPLNRYTLVVNCVSRFQLRSSAEMLYAEVQRYNLAEASRSKWTPSVLTLSSWSFEPLIQMDLGDIMIKFVCEAPEYKDSFQRMWEDCEVDIDDWEFTGASTLPTQCSLVMRHIPDNPHNLKSENEHSVDNDYMLDHCTAESLELPLQAPPELPLLDLDEADVPSSFDPDAPYFQKALRSRGYDPRFPANAQPHMKPQPAAEALPSAEESAPQLSSVEEPDDDNMVMAGFVEAEIEDPEGRSPSTAFLGDLSEEDDELASLLRIGGSDRHATAEDNTVPDGLTHSERLLRVYNEQFDVEAHKTNSFVENTTHILHGAPRR